MIKKIRNILVLILLIQVFIFINQNIEGHRFELSQNSEPYIELINIDEVQEFEIKDKAGHLKFEKIGKNWFLNENGGRVSSEKVKKLFSSIKDIANFRSDIVSEISLSSFMVNDDNFNKMITLTGAQTLVLFFGSTDKTGRSYLRVKDEQKVYGVNFVLDSLVTEPKFWLKLESQKNFGDSESK